MANKSKTDIAIAIMAGVAIFGLAAYIHLQFCKESRVLYGHTVEQMDTMKVHQKVYVVKEVTVEYEYSDRKEASKIEVEDMARMTAESGFDTIYYRVFKAKVDTTYTRYNL